MQPDNTIIQKIRTTNTSTKKVVVPLIIEPHPKDYSGYPFITLVQYRKQPMLVIVDNINDEVIRTYVLDSCGPEGIDEEVLFRTAASWFEQDKDHFPISVKFSRLGLTGEMSKIYRSLNVEFVSRIIGPVPNYPMNTVKSIKRRRRKPIPAGLEIVEVLTVDNIFE